MRSSLAFVVLWSATALAQPGADPPPPAPGADPPSEAPGADATSGPPGTEAPSEAPGTQEPEPEPESEPTLTTLDLDELPAKCRDLGKLADSPSQNRALSARISLASCLAEQGTKPLLLCDCEQSVIDVNAVLDPIITLLDEVFAVGDPTMKILARHAQGEMLSGFAIRIAATVPPPLNSSPEALALRETRLAMVQPLVQPWLARARTAYVEIDKLARENPKLTKNPAVAVAVRTSRAKLPPEVAKR